MKVKRLDELYSWKQIRKLQTIHDFNRYDGFVPVVIYAPYGGRESYLGGKDDRYEWYGKKTPYFVRRLWEAVRTRLADKEAEALEFNIVERSESFNTIQFMRPQLVRDYCIEFRKLMKLFADDGMVECSVGRLPPRNHPWNYGYDIDYSPFDSCSALYESTYYEAPFLSWMIEKGASPNVISWISASEFPQTALQSICDDIHAYGEDLERLENIPCLKEREENTFVNWCQISMMTEEVKMIQQLVLNQCFFFSRLFAVEFNIGKRRVLPDGRTEGQRDLWYNIAEKKRLGEYPSQQSQNDFGI